MDASCLYYFLRSLQAALAMIHADPGAPENLPLMEAYGRYLELVQEMSHKVLAQLKHELRRIGGQSEGVSALIEELSNVHQVRKAVKDAVCVAKNLPILTVMVTEMKRELIEGNHRRVGELASACQCFPEILALGAEGRLAEFRQKQLKSYRRRWNKNFLKEWTA